MLSYPEIHDQGVKMNGPVDGELVLAAGRSRPLEQVRARERIRYTYDFGDDWEHEILLEGVLTAEPGVRYPVCVAGEGACPPEDCGGVWAYQDLRDALADPAHERHEEMLEWLGLQTAAEFDPARFDVEEVNWALGAGEDVRGGVYSAEDPRAMVVRRAA